MPRGRSSPWAHPGTDLRVPRLSRASVAGTNAPATHIPERHSPVPPTRVPAVRCHGTRGAGHHGAHRDAGEVDRAQCRLSGFTYRAGVCGAHADLPGARLET